ncbi:hypothetical protein HK104_007938, partial [Borealophlyctis nickersoniae]
NFTNLDVKDNTLETTTSLNMRIPDTTSLAPAREDEAQALDSFSMGELYLFFREEIYPTINTQMPQYKAFFMSPLVQRWLDRNCPAGKDWRKRDFYKIILKTIKEIETEEMDAAENLPPYV